MFVAWCARFQKTWKPGEIASRSEEHTSELQSLPTRRSSDLTASKLEGTSPSLLAAMGAHVCCLVRAIPENMETGGDSVLYFDGGIEDLVNKWRMISEDTEIIKEYASKGYERVVSHFDWDAVTTQYLKAYNDIVGGVSEET